METIGHRIKSLMKTKNLKVEDLASVLDVKVRTIKSYTFNERNPSSDQLVTLADLFGVTVDFLATGKVDTAEADEADLVHAQVQGQNGPKLTEHDFVLIPISSAHASAGPGFIPPEERFIGALAFNRYWLKRENVNPDHATLVKVRGDSMEPTLHDGAVVLVDHRRCEPAARKGIFALRIGEDVMVKRLEQVDGVLVITSDNPLHDSRAISGKALGDVAIIGRVVWHGYTHRTDRS